MQSQTDFINIEEVTREDVLALCEQAAAFEKNGIPMDTLHGKVIASLFFETSTRTRLSFETAVHRLGGSIVGFAGIEGTSMHKKGESFEDTIRMVDGYADAIVMRHPEIGSAQRAADVAKHIVINAGDGANQHPSQSLLDLFAIYKAHGTLENLTVAFVGDLKYGRVPHSTAKALSLFPSTKQIWIAPDSLRMPEDVYTYVTQRGVNVEQTTELAANIPNVDILYMTRVQVERFENPAEYERLKDVYILKPEMLDNAKESMRILHALPRRYEIPEAIDASPHAYYFEQAKGGVAVRAALLTALLGS
jgi:aspartate carbamoyltransferase catalytic subunit